MEMSCAKKNLVKIAAALGFVQGLSWFIMSLTVIILYFSKPKYTTHLSYANLLEINIYYHFIFTDDHMMNSSFVIGPYQFIIFMWLYFFLSIIWTTLSGVLFCVVGFNNRRSIASTTMYLWGTLVLVLSVIDFVLVCILGYDYNKCPNGDGFCNISVGVVMTLAARGFVLWIINFVLAIMLLNFGVKVSKIRNGSKMESHPYPTQSIPRIPQPDYPQHLEINGRSNGYQNMSNNLPQADYPQQLSNNGRSNALQTSMPNSYVGQNINSNFHSNYNRLVPPYNRTQSYY